MRFLVCFIRSVFILQPFLYIGDRIKFPIIINFSGEHFEPIPLQSNILVDTIILIYFREKGQGHFYMIFRLVFCLLPP